MRRSHSHGLINWEDSDFMTCFINLDLQDGRGYGFKQINTKILSNRFWSKNISLIMIIHF